MASLTPPRPSPTEQPSPARPTDLRRKVIEAQVHLGRLTRSDAGGADLFLARMDLALSRVNTLRPVRVVQLYLLRNGPLMAAGLAYRLFFTIAALLFVGFSIFGLVLADDERLQGIVVSALDASIPGLVAQDGDGGQEAQDGLVHPDALFNSGARFGVALLISVVVTLATALGWVAGMREAMRRIFDLPPPTALPVLIKLKDLGTLALLGVVMLVTTVLGVLVNTTLGALLTFLDLSDATRMFTQIAGFGIMVLLDTLVAMVLLRSASAIEMPASVLLQGAIIAGVGSTLLRSFSTVLLSGLGRNAILLQFAVILGLFIWFFFLSQIYLLATSWCAVGSADRELRSKRLHKARSGTLKQQSRRRQHSP